MVKFRIVEDSYFFKSSLGLGEGNYLTFPKFQNDKRGWVGGSQKNLETNFMLVLLLIADMEKGADIVCGNF